MSSLKDRSNARSMTIISTASAITAERRNYLKNKAGRVWGGDRHRGRLPIPKHAHPMVRLLFVEMNRQMTTIREVADRSGVNYSAIKGWRSRYVPTVANLDAAFNAIGLRLAILPLEDDE